MYLQTDPIALDVSELREGLHRDVNGSLDGLNDQQRLRDREETYVVISSRRDVHHSRAVAVRQDIGGRSSRRGCRGFWDSRGIRTRTRTNNEGIGGKRHEGWEDIKFLNVVRATMGLL
jgi:hypothetical protein